MVNKQEAKVNICDMCFFKHIVKQYITDDQFEMLYKSSIQLSFKKGETILKQGNSFTHVAYLRSGRAKFNYEISKEKNLLLTVVNSPNLLGGANIFNNDVNLFSIVAIEDCEVCMIDISILKTFATSNAGLAIKLLEFVTSLFKDSIINFVSLAHKQVNGRIADILIYLSQNIYKSNDFTLTLSRKEIAEFAGCSQENVIHTLSRFNKEGIINLSGKNIEIVNLEKLVEVSKVG